jgi:2-keto-3-deoxy-L-rhamnonate aldolase RhmA
MLQNHLLKKISSNIPIIGTMLAEIRNPLIIPLLEKAGFDFVIVDMEHGTYSFYDVLQFVLAAKSTSLTVLVRTPGKDGQMISKVFDSGALGIMVPRVETVEEVRKIIDMTKYPPIGTRGYGPRGILTDFDSLSTEEKISLINQETLIWLQIESHNAVQQISSLINFSEINGIVIGPADLSISMAIPGQFKNPLMIETCENVLNACLKKGIPCGIHLRDLDSLKYWKQKGMKILIYTTPFDLLLEKFALDIKELK